jgi:hypothetical protein
MHHDDGSMRWYGYVALPLTVTVGVAIFCAYHVCWYGIALTAKREETDKNIPRSRYSQLEEIRE